MAVLYLFVNLSKELLALPDPKDVVIGLMGILVVSEIGTFILSLGSGRVVVVTFKEVASDLSTSVNLIICLTLINGGRYQNEKRDLRCTVLIKSLLPRLSSHNDSGPYCCIYM